MRDVSKYAELQVFGGLVLGGNSADNALRNAELRLVEAVSRSLPPEWRPGSSLSQSNPLTPAHWVEIPYRDQQDLALKIARLLVTYDLWFPRALACRFILCPLPQGPGTAGRHIYQGDGLTLAHALNFWTGIRWTDAKPFELSLGAEEHELASRLSLAYRKVPLNQTAAQG